MSRDRSDLVSAIDVAVEANGAGTVVTVADHGPGVSPDLGPRIFEPYITTKADGTGLGLALVRQTIDAHRGAISLSDTPGGVRWAGASVPGLHNHEVLEDVLGLSQQEVEDLAARGAI